MKAKEVKKAAARVAKKTGRALQPVVKKAKRAAEDASDALKKKGRAVAKKALLASADQLTKAAKAI